MGAVSISRMGGPPPFIALAKTLQDIAFTMCLRDDSIFYAV